MGDLERGEEYTGLIGGLSPGPWLCAMDIPHDRETLVQIEKVVKRTEVEFVQAGGRKERKADYGSLKFVGKAKELGLNATLKRTLVALFGPSAAALKGKWIALYVDTNVKVGGNVVCAVRIRARQVDPKEVAKGAASAPAGSSVPTPREPGQEG